MRKALAGLLLVASLATGAQAAVTPVADPVLERRVGALSQELRCVVCQNQTIADSQAELALDLRRQVREQLAQGMSEQEVVDYVVQRYGDFVLYRPPLRTTTVLLWFGPALLLAAGILAFGVRLAHQRRQVPALAADDLAWAARLLDDDKELR